ncbi:MAG: radical SAM protein [Candidatus Thermoplasmatota archaeon]
MTGSKPCPVVRRVRAGRALSISRLPGLSHALNPYVGCAHRCAYCYAQDVLRMGGRGGWGTWVDVKSNIPGLLSKEMKRWNGETIGLGTVTDPYQPVEQRIGLSRACLGILLAYDPSVCVQTKSDLVLRDMELLSSFSKPEVGLTITTLDEEVRRLIEPGAPPPGKRLAAMRALSETGIETWLFLGPVISGLNDAAESIEAIVEHAAEAGAKRILYDRYRAKPVADLRMRQVLGGRFEPRGSMDWVAHLRSAAMTNGLSAVEAF